jgi:hypothetical protein
MIKDFGTDVEDRIRMELITPELALIDPELAERELITPELALIDPELAERARRLLPMPRDCLAPRPWPMPRPEVRPQVESRLRRRPSLLVVVSALCLAALVGTPTLRHSSGEPEQVNGGAALTDGPTGTVPTGASPLSPPAGSASSRVCRPAASGS